MKKILAAVTCIVLLNSCSLFRKSEKTGCPSNGRNVGAEKILAGDQKAIKESNKAKYKGKKSY
jgi:hypothetical protein